MDKLLLLAVLGYAVGAATTVASRSVGGPQLVPPGLEVAVQHVPEHAKTVLQAIINGGVGASAVTGVAAVAKAIAKALGKAKH